MVESITERLSSLHADPGLIGIITVAFAVFAWVGACVGAAGGNSSTVQVTATRLEPSARITRGSDCDCVGDVRAQTRGFGCAGTGAFGCGNGSTRGVVRLLSLLLRLIWRC
jgi:hypothetical protein